MSEQDKSRDIPGNEPTEDLNQSAQAAMDEAADVAAEAAAEGGDEGADKGPGAEEQLAQLSEELAQTRKALAEADLRAQAEIQNMRRRMEREVANAHKFAVEKFAGEIISVADSLERGLAALNAEDEAQAPAREGLELTLKLLLDVFGRFNIEQINPPGQPFNPDLHEAMAMVPSPDAEPNSVIEVLEKGYALNGRLLRPARVVVAKA
ncbi:nucleotide exchange factor GrpE [Alcanivorax quisquiliarum]|uniref:Protein GrpE n=1 Tax=Alcanivorax quisquiliarum TaxID=2933565 RepID=A0ABT0E8V5_9GAMM|nr:nucleotide exchange factor GrpE [Alcanivorax quisquiliarum]MCK0538064.1 nucleotide exchange factor GrpE [Alcanivorax quisquiliarum]